MSDEPRREGASDAVAALALPGEFEWGGKTYKVSPVTLGVEARFSQRLIERAYAGLAAARTAMGEQTYQDAVRQANADLAAYEFEWNGGIARRATQTLPGQQELAYLCIAVLQPDVTRESLGPVFDDDAAWGRLVLLLRHQSAVPKNGQGRQAAPAPQ